MRKFFFTLALAFALVTMAFAGMCAATDYTWAGIDDDWGNKENWNGGTEYPYYTTDTAIFPPGINVNVTNVKSDSGTIAALTIGDNAKVTLTINKNFTVKKLSVGEGATLTTKQKFIAQNYGFNSLSNGTLEITGGDILTVSGSSIDVGTGAKGIGFDYAIDTTKTPTTTINIIANPYYRVTLIGGDAVISGDSEGTHLEITGGDLNLTRGVATREIQLNTTTKVISALKFYVDYAVNDGKITLPSKGVEIDNKNSNRLLFSNSNPSPNLNITGKNVKLTGGSLTYTDSDTNILKLNNATLTLGKFGVDTGAGDKIFTFEDTTVKNGDTITVTGGTVAFKNLALGDTATLTTGAASITGGAITGSLTNTGTLSDGTLSGDSTIAGMTLDNVTIIGGTITGSLTQSSTFLNGTVAGDSSIANLAFDGMSITGGAVTASSSTLKDTTITGGTLKITGGSLTGTTTVDGTLEFDKSSIVTANGTTVNISASGTLKFASEIAVGTLRTANGATLNVASCDLKSSTGNAIVNRAANLDIADRLNIIAPASTDITDGAILFTCVSDAAAEELAQKLSVTPSDVVAEADGVNVILKAYVAPVAPVSYDVKISGDDLTCATSDPTYTTARTWGVTVIEYRGPDSSDVTASTTHTWTLKNSNGEPVLPDITTRLGTTSSVVFAPSTYLIDPGVYSLTYTGILPDGSSVSSSIAITITQGSTDDDPPDDDPPGDDPPDDDPPDDDPPDDDPPGDDPPDDDPPDDEPPDDDPPDDEPPDDEPPDDDPPDDEPPDDDPPDNASPPDNELPDNGSGDGSSGGNTNKPGVNFHNGDVTATPTSITRDDITVTDSSGTPVNVNVIVSADVPVLDPRTGAAIVDDNNEPITVTLIVFNSDKNEKLSQLYMTYDSWVLVNDANQTIPVTNRSELEEHYSSIYPVVLKNGIITARGYDIGGNLLASAITNDLKLTFNVFDFLPDGAIDGTCDEFSIYLAAIDRNATASADKLSLANISTSPAHNAAPAGEVPISKPVNLSVNGGKFYGILSPDKISCSGGETAIFTATWTREFAPVTAPAITAAINIMDWSWTDLTTGQDASKYISRVTDSKNNTAFTFSVKNVSQTVQLHADATGTATLTGSARPVTAWAHNKTIVTVNPSGSSDRSHGNGGCDTGFGIIALALALAPGIARWTRFMLYFSRALNDQHRLIFNVLQRRCSHEKNHVSDPLLPAPGLPRIRRTRRLPQDEHPAQPQSTRR